MVQNKVTNVAEVPFENPNYNQINSIGRQWIFEYTLAIAKEMLGYIRGKYGTIPIPECKCDIKPIRFNISCYIRKKCINRKIKGIILMKPLEISY